jgi:hypothetical protein
MRKCSVQAAAFFVLVLGFVAGPVPATQRKVQAKPSAELKKLLPTVVRPATLKYSAIASRAALLRIPPLFSDVNKLAKGSGSAAADPASGAVSCTIVDDGNSCATAGFWGNGLVNAGGTVITGVAGSAVLSVTQLVGEASVWMIVYEEGGGFAVPPSFIPIKNPGPVTMHSPAFSMEPGKKYSLVVYVSLPQVFSLNSDPINANATHAAMALSGKFETVKFTVN